MKNEIKIKLGLVVILILFIFVILIFFASFVQKNEKGGTLLNNKKIDNNNKINEEKKDLALSLNQTGEKLQETPKPIIQNSGEGEIFQINAIKEPYIIVVIDKDKKSHSLEITEQTLIQINNEKQKGVNLLNQLKIGDKVAFSAKGEQDKTYQAQTIILKQKSQTPEPKEIYSYEGKVKELSENYFILEIAQIGKDIKVIFDNNTKFLGGKVQLGDAVMATNPDENLKGKTEFYAKYVQKL